VAKFVRGDVVVVPFPFSDLSNSKRRPALVLSDLQGDDVILCQITGQTTHDSYAISLDDREFLSGGLKQKSNIRPNRLFTADSRILLYSAGRLNPSKLHEVIDGLVAILRQAL
jgi:mRNA interferase MazF